MSILQHYRDLEQASHLMLEAASAGRWDEVTRLETECDRRIADLRAARTVAAMSQTDERERMRILHNIVRIDAKIRDLAQPWFGKLDRLMNSRWLSSGN
jgi:Flagellar protein FliT